MSRERQDPTAVVGGAVRGLAVRRLGRAFVPLAALVLTGLSLGLAGLVDPATAVGIGLGAIGSAAALLVLGQHAVRRAHRLPSEGGWRFAALAWVVPWAWGLWLLAVPSLGLGRRSLAEGAWVSVGLATVTGVLGVLVLRDALRIGELSRLADTMSVPAPDEDPAA